MSISTLSGPLAIRPTLVIKLLQVITASLFIAFCAQIGIPLTFTPVPFTFLTLSVILVGTVLGSRAGLLAVAAYLIEGAFGLPVFSSGSSGIVVLLGPRGGYLLSCMVMAYLSGYLAERGPKSRSVYYLGLCSVCALQLAMGAIWLAQFLGWSKAFFVGFLPFVPGEMIKSALVTKYFNQCKGQ